MADVYIYIYIICKIVEYTYKIMYIDMDMAIIKLWTELSSQLFDDVM